MKKLTLSSLAFALITVVTAGSAIAGPSATATTTPPAAGTVVAVCDASVAGAGSKPIYGGSGYVFVPGTDTAVFAQTGFTAQCSNNTTVSFQEPDTTSAAVLGVSTKGNQVVGGSTAGGGVKTISKCAADPCVPGTDLSSGNWTTAKSGS
jgi:hypothetical protein